MKKQTGLTLIEIMIALLLSLIVIGGAISIYISTIKGSTDTMRSNRLNYDLDSTMQLVINDIRRAGYWGGAIAGANSQNNPFMLAATNVQIPSSNCIVYTYDADADSNVGANEYYGFRLTNNGVIEIKLTGTTTANCTEGTWEPITISEGGDQIEITRLEFSFDPITLPPLIGSSKCLNTAILIDNTATPPNPLESLCTGIPTGNRAIETRQVNIALEAEMVNDDTVTKSISNSVRIRNDRIFTAP